MTSFMRMIRPPRRSPEEVNLNTGLGMFGRRAKAPPLPVADRGEVFIFPGILSSGGGKLKKEKSDKTDPRAGKLAYSMLILSNS